MAVNHDCLRWKPSLGNTLGTVRYQPADGEEKLLRVNE